MVSCYMRLCAALREKRVHGFSFDEAERFAHETLTSPSRFTPVFMVCGAFIGVLLCMLPMTAPHFHGAILGGAVAIVLSAATGTVAGYGTALVVQLTALTTLCEVVADLENRFPLAGIVSDSFTGDSIRAVPGSVLKVINSSALRARPVSPGVFFEEDGRFALQYATAVATLRRGLFLKEGLNA
jgi:predicted amidohydrolase